jgi:hypothetical protein
MTSVHLPKLLSIEDWDALPEDNGARIELQEGVLIVTPRPLRPNARATFRIAKQLDDQLPEDLEAIIECVDTGVVANVGVQDERVRVEVFQRACRLVGAVAGNFGGGGSRSWRPFLCEGVQVGACSVCLLALEIWAGIRAA